MKKIYLICAKKTALGGKENYLLRLSNKMIDLDIDHEIIHSNIPSFLPSWLRVLLFNCYLKIIKRNKFYFSLERISNPDIYRAGDGVHKVHIRNVNKSLFNPLHPVYLSLEEKCFNKAKKIIVNSKMVKNEIIESYGVKENKISVIYNGYDPEKIDYYESYGRISKEFLIENRDYILLYAGSGFHRKGVERFIKIISQLKNKSFIAFVVGKESNMNYYKNLTKEESIDDKVIFTGSREDLNDFYNISDFFIFPTKYEPFGNVVLEAMSYGNVVFTTSKNGASEILNPEFIMRSADDKSVIKKIDDLAEDRALLSEIKIQNIDASKKFSVNRNLTETLRAINEVID